MVEMMEEFHARTARTKHKKPELTVKSYVLQSIEACSREAKLAWCWRNGVRVTSLQHDGVFVTGTRTDAQWRTLERALTAASRLACKYRTEVEVKHVPAWTGVRIGDELTVS